MDFHVLNWQERNYKKLILILVLVATFFVGFWCYYKDFSTKDTFFASIAYAFFLFVIGVYSSYMASKANDYIDERSETYLNLKKLIELMDMFDVYSSNISVIENFRQVTGRNDIKGTNNTLTWRFPISEETERTLRPLEDMYLSQNAKLCTVIESIVNNYINLNRISVKCNTVKRIKDGANTYVCELSISDALRFSIETWCDEHLEYKKDKQKLVNNYYREIASAKAELEDLGQMYLHLMSQYSQLKQCAKRNYSSLKKLYGKRIDYTLNRLYEVSNGFYNTIKELDSMKDEILDCISEYCDNILTNTDWDNKSDYLESLESDIAETKEMMYALITKDSNNSK